MVRHGPAWSGMVRDTTTEVLKCLKLPGLSVTVRDDTLIRGSPGQSGDGPCSDRVGSGKVRSGTVLIRGDPACLVGDFLLN